eukprot:jgi/Picsp_1/5889/NSC_03246-R1_thiamine monophosphate synthase
MCARFIVITPPETGLQEVSHVLSMLQNGIPTVHVRKPTFSPEDTEAYVNHFSEKYRSRLVLHQHHEIATKFKLGGIHYKERDIPRTVKVAPGNLTTSVSYHKTEQLLECKGAVDYCFLSPIYSSISKQGYEPGKELQDKGSLGGYVASSRAPVVALGGIQPSNFEDIAELGFQGVALLGYVWNQPDPVEAASLALEAFKEASWFE